MHRPIIMPTDIKIIISKLSFFDESCAMTVTSSVIVPLVVTVLLFVGVMTGSLIVVVPLMDTVLVLVGETVSAPLLLIVVSILLVGLEKVSVEIELTIRLVEIDELLIVPVVTVLGVLLTISVVLELLVLKKLVKIAVEKELVKKVLEITFDAVVNSIDVVTKALVMENDEINSVVVCVVVSS